jgi:hypothetical protein
MHPAAVNMWYNQPDSKKTQMRMRSSLLEEKDHVQMPEANYSLG